MQLPTTPTSQDPPEGQAAHDPYGAWRHRDFSLFVVGWAISLMGQQIQATALSYEIFQKTGGFLSQGMIGLVQALPVMLLALPAGHVADRFDRRLTMLAAQIIAGVCSVALAVISFCHFDYRWMYLPLTITSIGFTFSRAARQALLTNLVPQRIFSNAVTWNSTVFETSSMIGPALGGLIIATSFAHLGSAGPAYVLAVVGQMGYAVFLLMMRPRPPVRSSGATTFAQLMAGVHYVWRVKLILATITLDLLAVLLGGVTCLMPAFSEYLHVGAVGYGALRAAPAAGAICMALVVAHMPPMKHAGRNLLWAVAGFGLATIVFGLSRNFWLSMAMLFLTGSFDNISVVVRHTLVQVMTPDSMRGRVSAVNNVFIGASNDLGTFESGVTAKWWGAVASVLVGGVGTLLVTIGVALKWRQILRLGSLNDLGVDPADADAAIVEPPPVSDLAQSSDFA